MNSFRRGLLTFLAAVAIIAGASTIKVSTSLAASTLSRALHCSFGDCHCRGFVGVDFTCQNCGHNRNYH